MAASIAAGAGAGAQDEDVPLYTNEDLERWFGPPPPAALPPPTAGDVEDPWEFVHDHLEREYSRIETERRLDLQRSITDRAPGDDEVRYPIYAGIPWVGYHHGWSGSRRNGYDRVRERFLLHYDQRTARHGYLVPCKDAGPSSAPRPDPARGNGSRAGSRSRH